MKKLKPKNTENSRQFIEDIGVANSHFKRFNLIGNQIHANLNHNNIPYHFLHSHIGKSLLTMIILSAGYNVDVNSSTAS